MALTKSGELLKATRLKKGLTLEDVERTTRIRVKFLRALEEGDFDKFHSTAYARGFLKNYCEFLGLDANVMLALFRRETTEQAVKILPQGIITSESSFFRITPTRAILFIALIVFAAIIYYLFQEYRGFLGAPVLTVEKPSEQEVVSEGELKVVGKADGDASVVVNGEPVSLGESGQFVKTIQVFKGETAITIVAKNRRGKETTVTRKIQVE